MLLKLQLVRWRFAHVAHGGSAVRGTAEEEEAAGIGFGSGIKAALPRRTSGGFGFGTVTFGTFGTAEEEAAALPPLLLSAAARAKFPALLCVVFPPRFDSSGWSGSSSL